MSSPSAPLKSGASLPLLKNLKTVNQYPRLRRAFGSLMSSAALLLPISTGAESHLQTGAPGAALKATAHVDFKIIIPPVLYLDVSDRGAAGVPGTQTVSIMSNSHNVTLAATAHTFDAARGNVILSAAARKVIAQDASCTLGSAHAAHPAPAPPSGTRAVICTASMP
jgi:hypothetical protein